MNNITYKNIYFSIHYDNQDLDNEGWAFSFIGDKISDGSHATASGPIDNIEELSEVLNAYAPNSFDFSELPSFGGEVPKDTCGIFSWDENRLLVEGFRVVPRNLFDS